MNRDNLDFGSGKIGSLFKAMFFPTLVGMLFNSELNVCDGMFGRIVINLCLDITSYLCKKECNGKESLHRVGGMSTSGRND